MNVSETGIKHLVASNLDKPGERREQPIYSTEGLQG